MPTELMRFSQALGLTLTAISVQSLPLQGMGRWRASNLQVRNSLPVQASSPDFSYLQLSINTIANVEWNSH